MKPVRCVIAVAYAAGIFYLSSRAWNGVPQIPHIDKVVHFCLYAGLAFLCAWSLGVTDRGARLQPAFIAFAITTTYGASDEIHQYFVPARSCDVMDLTADAAGAVVGVLIAILISRWVASHCADGCADGG